MIPIQTGNCPKCGGPIWSTPDPTNPMAIPQTVFTCECRNKVEFQPLVPQPWIVPIYPQPQPSYPQPQPSYPDVFPYWQPTWIGSGVAGQTSPGCAGISVYTNPHSGNGGVGCSKTSGKVE